MRKFEYIEILKPDTTEENIKKHIEKITKYLKNKNCQDIEIEKIGIKLLAYETQGFNKGYYILIQGNYINEKNYCNMSNWLDWRNKNFNKKYLEVLKNIIVKVD